MTDYMEQDAERLIQTLESCAVDPMSNGYAEVSKRLLVAAACSLRTLLAHIQRGTVPEGWQLAPKVPTPIMVNAPKERDRYGSAHVVSIYTAMLADAPAPDQFRDAAGMMAEPVRVETFDVGFLESLGAEVPAPAEVPTPEPSLFSIRHRDKSAKGVWYEWRDSEPTRWADHVARYKLEDYPADEKRLALFYAEDQMRTYGDAREAAGYARGLAEAGRDADAFRAAVRLGLCVNCYTSSDCMADGSAAVEIYASEIADSIHVKAIPDPYAAARSAVFAAANQIDALRGEVKP